MKLFKVIFFSLGLMVVSCCFSLQAKDLGENQIEQFDLKLYHPEKYGLKDLVFHVRISNLADMLKKNLSINVGDVYFKVYWSFPGNYHVEVEGIHDNLKNVKNELKALVMTRLDFVIPETLKGKLKSYRLKSKKIDSGVLVKAYDDSQLKSINEIQLKFDKIGRMFQMKIFSPSGVQTSNISYKVLSWSRNKWIPSLISAESIQGARKTIMTTEIEYLSQNGFGFPKTVSVETKQFINIKDKQTEVSKAGTVIRFYDYKINKNIANKKIAEIKKADSK